MESEERSSTGSTVSGVFKTILQSPTPICMFYFSHPFGISTPQVKSSFSSEKNDMSNTYRAKRTYQKEKIENHGYYYDSHQRNCVNSNHSQDGTVRLIPWPRNTWKRDFVLPPLIQFRGQRDDDFAPDLETVLKTIRQAWNSPTGYANLQNQNYDTFCKQFVNHKYVNKMDVGNKGVPTCSRLLKRRYSLPEIIMRKHELAQRKPFGNFSSESVPCSKVIPPPTGISNSNSTSSISRNILTDSSGSDNNLSRASPHVSLRKSSILRQMWGKETRLRQSKTSSLRLLSQREYCAEGNDLHCMECKRLHISRDDDDDIAEDSQRYLLNSHLKQMKNPPSSETASIISDVSQISTQESLTCKQESESSPAKPDLIMETTNSSSISDTQKNESSSEVKETTIVNDQSEKSSAAGYTESSDSALDILISQMLIENLHDLAEDARERCKRKQYVECFKINGSCSNFSETDKICIDEAETEYDSKTTLCTLQITTDNPQDENENTQNDSSGCSNEIENIPADDIIQIRAGSLYPPFTEEFDLVVVPRVLKLFPRTESVEVQPSSASLVEEETFCNNSDESLSLVDSLDDPNVHSDNETSSPSTQNDNCKFHSSPLKEKSKAFFVPIVDLGHENMNSMPVVSETMPEKLKERIEQRQMELDARKECYKKQHNLQSTIEESSNYKSENESTSESRLKQKKRLVPIETKSQSKSSSKELLRSDIGLLESYTIDSRGNLQFRPPQKAEPKVGNSLKSTTVKKQNIVTYRPPKSVKTSSSSSSYFKKHKKSPNKDVQKMTIFQTQSDIITPDHENGPKRIYQKTEIQDGDKRIEILEIVECVESSEENSRQTRSKFITKSASLRRSRIPVPIYKIGRSAGCQKPVRNRDSCHVLSRSAELLVGAFNRSDQTVIEVLRSPREIISSRSIRGQISLKRCTPKRSSSSGKYQQIFEVIPEEKSSLSMESSNEETEKETRNCEEQSGNGNYSTGSITSNSNITKPVMTTTTLTGTSPIIVKTPSRGREGVESVEPKAWVGFLDTQESFVEEEDGTTQPYPSSTTEGSYYTLTSISTAAATQGTQTPRNESVTRSSSTGSDNVLEVIRKTNSDSENTEQGIESSSKYCNKSPINPKHHHCIQVKECKTTSVNENLNVHEESKINLDEKFIPHKPCNQSESIDIWRVQSPDACMRAIPKTKACSTCDKCPVDCETTEIDSRSFIICSDDSPINISDQTSTIQNDFDEHARIATEPFNMCTVCCFCNPNLHRTKLVNSEKCLYCNRKKTPQKKEEETNTESDFFTIQDIYQTTSIKDHRHTMSRDSDSVSTKCTKTNEKIKKYIPDSSRASKESFSNIKKNLNRPKNVNNLPKFQKSPINKMKKDTMKSNPSSESSADFRSKLGSFPDLHKQFSSCGYDRSSSPTSSSDSTCPTTPERRLLFPKVKCRNKRGKIKKGNESTVKNIKKEKTPENKTPPMNTNTTNAGWTVTLAGTCTQGPPPDVEMRLSFLKEPVTAAITKIEEIDCKNRLEDRRTEKDLSCDRNDNTRRNTALPPAGNTDTKKVLPNNQTGNSFQRDLIFPEVAIGTPPQNQIVPRHVTTKKAIRHLECNVAVTSATRTVSNISRGRRTMSYQALNIGEPQKYSSRERQLRDSSLDLGFLSSRRMSFGSQSPLETMALSIMGNAIAPEQKPRVPTMSERDLTRRHSRCFTRNRAFFT